LQCAFFLKRLNDFEISTVDRDGEEWLRFRRIMNRLLLLPTSGCELIKPCDAVATELVDRWAKKYSGRELAALELELYRWANKSEFLIRYRE
jgi:ecdysteroid 2-hydroxylase